MSDLSFAGIPGEAPDDVTPSNVPVAVADTQLPTGTPMDLAAPDQPVDLTDPMAAGLAAFFEHQEKFRHPTPGLDTASAAPTPDPTAEPAAPAPTPAPEGTSRISAPAQSQSQAQPPIVEEGSVQGDPALSAEPSSATPPVPAGEPPVVAPAADPQLAATAPVSPEPPGLSSTPPESWVPAGHVIVGERPIPESELPQLLRVYDWARSMPPELAQAIQDLQSGNFILTPRHQAQPQSPYSPASGSGVPPVPDSSGGGWGQPPQQLQQFDPSQSLDPQLAAQVNYIAQQQAALQAQLQAQAQQQQAAQRQAFEAQIASARTTFASDPNRNLSAPEMHYLTDRVAAMQMFPALLQQHGGDVSKAMVAALDAAYWADESFRSRHTNGQVQSQLDQALLQNQDLQLKRQRAASLAGTSTPVSRTPPAAAPLTRESAANGMVSEIAAALSGGSPNNGSN